MRYPHWFQVRFVGMSDTQAELMSWLKHLMNCFNHLELYPACIRQSGWYKHDYVHLWDKNVQPCRIKHVSIVNRKWKVREWIILAPKNNNKDTKPFKLEAWPPFVQEFLNPPLFPAPPDVMLITFFLINLTYSSLTSDILCFVCV